MIDSKINLLRSRPRITHLGRGYQEHSKRDRMIQDRPGNVSSNNQPVPDPDEQEEDDEEDAFPILNRASVTTNAKRKNVSLVILISTTDTGIHCQR